MTGPHRSRSTHEPFSKLSSTFSASPLIFFFDPDSIWNRIYLHRQFSSLFLLCSQSLAECIVSVT